MESIRTHTWRMGAESAALVSLDNSWEFDENIAYSRYWPYTETYDINSEHQKYVEAHYPGVPGIMRITP